jgi:hypothetical protein
VGFSAGGVPWERELSAGRSSRNMVQAAGAHRRAPVAVLGDAIAYTCCRIMLRDGGDPVPSRVHEYAMHRVTSVAQLSTGVAAGVSTR